MEQNLKTFIEGMPKTELHLHIEGTLEPELMWTLAERNGVKLPYANVEELRQKYDFYRKERGYRDLQEFLDLYYQGMDVLRKEEDFYDLAYAYLKKAASQHVTHTEMFFDPQGHTRRGIPFETVLHGLRRAMADAEKEFGITSKLSLSFLRHLSQDDAFKTLEQARPYLDQIDSFGLDSSENGHPPSKFVDVFAAVRALGKPVTAHAGEEGPPDFVREALDLLKVKRIDHGNRALEDKSLVKRLVKEGIGLTVCPLSNLKLKVIKDILQHPLKTMLHLGLKATVNSDDPAYFGGYMNENFLAAAEALDLTRKDIVTLARNAIEISFLSPQEKAQKNEALDAYIARAMPGERVVNGGNGNSRGGF